VFTLFILISDFIFEIVRWIVFIPFTGPVTEGETENAKENGPGVFSIVFSRWVHKVLRGAFVDQLLHVGLYSSRVLLTLKLTQFVLPALSHTPDLKVEYTDDCDWQIEGYKRGYQCQVLA